MPRPGLTPAFIAELLAGSVRPIMLLSAVFTSGTSYLWSGAGTLTWNGHDWIGLGKLGGISPITEPAKVQAANVTLTLSGVDPDILGKALGECRQGNEVVIWFGFLDSTGAVVADPAEAWHGRMDVPMIYEDPENPRITLTVESWLAALKKPQPRRYTDADQKAYFPADKGFEYVAQLQEMNVVWGKAGIPGGGGIGGSACFDGPTVLQTSARLERFDALPRDRAFRIRNVTGEHMAELLVHEDADCELIVLPRDAGRVTLEHPFGDPLLFAWTSAETRYASAPRVRHRGPLFNLHILSRDPKDHHYLLRNGEIAHNKLAPPGDFIG